MVVCPVLVSTFLTTEDRMCYRCSYCDEVSGGGQPLLKHKEVPVCKDCHSRLSHGIPTSELVRRLKLRGKYNPIATRKIVAYDGLTMFRGEAAVRFTRYGERPLVVKDKETGEQKQVVRAPLLAPKTRAVQFGSATNTTNGG